MKEIKSYLKKRWENDLKPIGDLVTDSLSRKGVLAKLNIPRTEEGLIDLRGFSAPKKYATKKSNSGKDKTYVTEGIRIKKINFDGVDASFSDFERCHFIDCNFHKSKFDEARFFATNYWGCSFNVINFMKTNFGHSTFQAGGLFRKKIKDNFGDIVFAEVNFSETHIHNQLFQNCYFSNCKTGALLLNSCILSNLNFNGFVKNLFIVNSRKVNLVDLSNSVISGLNLEHQSLTGFKFPVGDSYYAFRNKSEELAKLSFIDKLTDQESKLVDSIKFVWSRNKMEVDFVDINWLSENDIGIGRKIIKELKSNSIT